MNPTVQRLCAAAVLLLLPGAIQSQSAATEYWEGSRSSAGRSQALALRVEFSGGSWKATVDLTDFGALDIPAAGFTMAAGRMHFELIGDSSTAVFDGKVAAASIRGTWREEGRSGEFQLRRAKDRRAGLREEGVFFPNGDVRLSGTLLLPVAHDPAPAIIFVHGAGPETRNASRFLAQFFAGHGMAALVYDKRGAGASTGDWMHSSFEDLAKDTVAAVNYLKTRREIDPARIGLMGSSQGGWVAPLAALRSPDVHFVIVKSGAGVTPEEQELARVEMQMRSDGNSPQDIQESLGLYRQVIAYARTRQGWDDLSIALKAASQKSWYYFGAVSKDWWFFDFIRLNIGYDPVPVVQQVKAPLLIIYGGKDRNLPLEASLRRLNPALSSAGRSSAIEIFPNAGHDLRVEPGKDEPWDFPRFAPGYLQLLASWVKLQTATTSGTKEPPVQ
jgi:pimeloyl-ACP methyl ester carboxylesterase